MLPLLVLALSGRALKLKLTALVSVQVTISGGEVRQPTPMLGSTWFLKPWPLESMVAMARLPVPTVLETLGSSGLEPLT